MTLLSKIETSYNLLDKNYKIAVISVVFISTFLVWLSFWSDVSNSSSKNKNNIAQVSGELNTLKKQSDILKKQIVSDKKQKYQKEEANLKQTLQDVEKQIGSFKYQLVSPKEAFFNLKNMLSIDKNVRLVSIHYLPEELVKDTVSQPVYRSPIELVIQGEFSDIVEYLKRAEKENTFIFWDEMQYKVSDFPVATVKLKIHVVTSEAGKEHVKVN